MPELQLGAAAVQSALLAQLARQLGSVGLHLSAPGQAAGAAGEQEPRPLQNRSGVSVLPVQVGWAQLTDVAANTHAAVSEVMGAH